MSEVDEANELSYFERIERIAQLIRDFNSKEDLYNSAIRLFDGSTDLGEDLDCAFRTRLRELLDFDLTDAKNRSSVVELLDYSISFTLEYFSKHSSLVKIPYFMFDDILQSQTIEGAESMWPSIEASMETFAPISTLYEAKYENKTFLARAQLNMLKACNALLRKLSKSCNTEFCGRVLMFLAKVFDISEKSAANLSGKINSSNLTQYESEAAFFETNKIVDDDNAMEVDTAVHSATEESKVESEGSLTASSSTGGELQGNLASLYNDYKTFWSLQSHFTATSADGKVLEGISKWREFHSNALSVLATLAKHNYSEAEIRQAAQTGQREVAYMGCKFLTSSQLFALELRDPNLRQQVVTQILFYLHHIAQKPVSFWETGDIASEVKKDILALFSGAKSVLQHTPGSDQLIEVLDRVLTRESHWVQWKFRDNCAPFEKKLLVAGRTGSLPQAGHVLKHLDLKTVSSWLSGSGSSSGTASAAAAATAAGGVGGGAAKRKRPAAADSLAGKKKGVLDTAEYEFDYSDKTVKEKARRLAEAMPTFEAEIEKYFDAEDPDAGIEDEYHPKHDSTYCWKTRRLMAAKKLFVFAAMPDGNIAKALPLLRPSLTSSSSSSSIAEQPAVLSDGGDEEAKGGEDQATAAAALVSDSSNGEAETAATIGAATGTAQNIVSSVEENSNASEDPIVVATTN